MKTVFTASELMEVALEELKRRLEGEQNEDMRDVSRQDERGREAGMADGIRVFAASRLASNAQSY